jgi:CheY-like chemotaxis protein/anti-sigma regulatory factor (Ser/Thr protein kinase)
MMWSDQRRVHQVLQNVMGNAVKFTTQGEISVGAREVHNLVEVTVRDTGIGIPPKDLPTIFEEFRQVDGTASRSFEGTGLGLAIAVKSAQLLGGRITVESRVGEGSVFTITLPLRLATAAKDEDAAIAIDDVVVGASRPASMTAPSNRRLLLVEDSEAAVVQIKLALETAGYTIDVARGGEEALLRMRQQPPDAIILDLMMPKIDGFAVLEQMRSTAATAETPVLILTAKDLTAEDRARLSANHVQQLVQKGDVDRRELLQRVERLFAALRPAVPAPKRPSARPIRKGAVRARIDRPATILVVEDNRDNLTTIRAVLHGKCDLLTADDGEAALQLALQHKPDLILLDMLIPKLDGVSVVRRLRTQDSTQAIPVVALTASAMSGDRERLLDAGCDDYLPKPIDIDALMQRVERWVGPLGAKVEG